MEANRPSRTAVLVARGVATIAATPGLASLVSPRAAEITRAILRCESSTSRAFVAASRLAPFRAIVFAISNAITPGVFLHFALRKRQIEAQVRAAIADGASQVVVVGAGLDPLAVSLAPEFRDVRFVEIDHPASQVSKRMLLPPDSAAIPNVVFRPLDLSLSETRLSDVREIDRTRPTVYVAEGLLMYLREEAVQRLFAMVRESTPRARVVFTAMTLQSDGRPGFRRSSGLVDRWLALRKEPFEWGIRPEDVPDFLAPLGFELRDHADAERFRREHAEIVGDRPIAEGEHVYVAESVGT